ncbi:MAG: phenylalanine--tRNA ligase subunit alpha, partial [Lysinibacillus sp.]
MEEQLKQLEQEALAKLEAATSLKELNDVRVAYLGKKGSITDLLKGMGKLSAEERPKMGALVNTVRENVTAQLEAKVAVLE